MAGASAAKAAGTRARARRQMPAGMKVKRAGLGEVFCVRLAIMVVIL